MFKCDLESNWRTVQAQHHASRARLLTAYAAAYESEARSSSDEGRRRYLMTKARGFRKDARMRFAKSAELSQSVAA